MVDRWGILLLIFLWFSAASRDVALDAGTSGSRWTTWPIGTEAELAASVRSSVDSAATPRVVKSSEPSAGESDPARAPLIECSSVIQNVRCKALFLLPKRLRVGAGHALTWAVTRFLAPSTVSQLVSAAFCLCDCLGHAVVAMASDCAGLI